MAAGRRYKSCVPTSLEYPRGGQLEVDQDPEGQSKGYDLTCLQTVPDHIAVIGAYFIGKESGSQESDR